MRSIQHLVEEYLDFARREAEIAKAMEQLREWIEVSLAKEPEKKYQCEGGTFALVKSPTKLLVLVDPTLLEPRYQTVTANSSKLRMALQLGLDVPARLEKPEKPLTLRIELKKEP